MQLEYFASCATTSPGINHRGIPGSIQLLIIGLFRLADIKTLQTVLLKVALVLGVEVYSGVEFQELVEPTDHQGWRVNVSPPTTSISNLDIDFVIGADGKKNVFEKVENAFTQVEMRGQCLNCGVYTLFFD